VPVSISYSTQPNAQLSARRIHRFPLRLLRRHVCRAVPAGSGAMSISLRKACTPSSIMTSLRSFPTGSPSPSRQEMYQRWLTDVGLKFEWQSARAVLLMLLVVLLVLSEFCISHVML